MKRSIEAVTDTTPLDGQTSVSEQFDARQVAEHELSIVIPTFNESGNVRELLNQISLAFPADCSMEVIFVDDSTDDTADMIAAAGPSFGFPVTLVHRAEPVGGLGGAVIEGLRLAKSPWAIVMDADLQHPPSLAPELYAAGMRSNAELVVATRYTPDASREGLGSTYRKLVSQIFTAIAGIVLGGSVARLSDPLSGFFAVRTGALRLEEARPLGYKILLELIVRFDLKLIEQMSYEFGPRHSGESKSTLREGFRFMAHLGRLWRTRLSRTAPAEPVASAVTMPGQRVGAKRSEPGADGRTSLDVLLVTSEAPPIVSGISRCVDRLAAGLRERGHRVDVVSSVQIPRLAVGEWRFSTLLLRWPAIARRFHRYDVINLHGPAPTISDVFLFMWRIFSSKMAPIVYTHHSALEIRGMERICALYNRLHRVLSMSAKITLATSQHYADLHRVPNGPSVRVAPWGVDLRPEPNRPERPHSAPLRVLFVGQMRSYKGVEWLLEAVAGQSALELTLVGGGPHLNDYRNMAARLGAGNVRFAGRIPDKELHAEYDRNDVVVLPSVTQAEAFGLVVLEGMAAGCVPVVSDLPGVRDLVAGIGTTVPARDAMSLRAALLDLAGDPARVSLLRKAARRRAEGLGWAVCIDRYEDALLDAVGAPRHARAPWVTRARVRTAAFAATPGRGAPAAIAARHGSRSRTMAADEYLELEVS
jgi:rhamnosyl/mannosyltransferase